MSIHDAFLELAAASIDFELDGDERGELDRHLAGCDACGRAMTSMRDDAATIAFGAVGDLPAARSDEILAAALRPRRNGPPLRVVGVVALVGVLSVGLVAAGIAYLRRPDQPAVAVVPGPSGSFAAVPSGEPTNAVEPTTPSSGGTPRPAASPTTATLPVIGLGQLLGTGVQMAPGTDGSLYVSVPADEGTTLSRLAADGKPSRGWPLLIPGARCTHLLSVDDGSIRIVCGQGESGLGDLIRAFAFDPDGTSLSGWPVDVGSGGGPAAGRVIGDELTLYLRQGLDSVLIPGAHAGDGWIVTVGADGTVSRGARAPYVLDYGFDTIGIGPDGIAYWTDRDHEDPTPMSVLNALGLAGVPPGFPIAIKGIASGPAFDAAGRIHLSIGSPYEQPAQLLVFDPDSREVTGSPALDMVASSNWNGDGAERPGVPLVAADGMSFLFDATDGATAIGLSPSGDVVAGWPYRSVRSRETTGICSPGYADCSQILAVPTVGPGDVLYLLLAGTTSSAGGSVIAIDPDGRVRDGWPVNLRNRGAEFWSIVVGVDGTAYVLAIEREPVGSSATIVAIAPNSKVEYTRTIIEPVDLAGGANPTPTGTTGQ